MRWDPDEDAPEAAPVVSTVNAWEIEELEDESEEEGGRAVGPLNEHLTSGTMSHVSVDEDTPRRKRKAGWEHEPADRGSAASVRVVFT